MLGEGIVVVQVSLVGLRVYSRGMSQQFSHQSQRSARLEQAPVGLGLHLLQSGTVVVFVAVLGQGEVAKMGVEPGGGDPLPSLFVS